jgi:AraC-like DNA-binding protein
LDAAASMPHRRTTDAILTANHATSQLGVVGRAKRFLQARPGEPTSLDEIADEAQGPSVCLTAAFTRSEGLPLCRYRMRLRLNRALGYLPRCEDITAFALKLGFSNRGQCSTAFKSLLGVLPSAFGAGRGKPRRALEAARPARRRRTGLNQEVASRLEKARSDARFASATGPLGACQSGNERP